MLIFRHCLLAVDFRKQPSSVTPEARTLPAGRGDEARHPGGPDPRGAVPIKQVRDIYIPDLHIDTLNVKARNFR
jgi:hypothetical protein